MKRSQLAVVAFVAFFLFETNVEAQQVKKTSLQRRTELAVRLGRLDYKVEDYLAAHEDGRLDPLYERDESDVTSEGPGSREIDQHKVERFLLRIRTASSRLGTAQPEGLENLSKEVDALERESGYVTVSLAHVRKLKRLGPVYEPLRQLLKDAKQLRSSIERFESTLEEVEEGQARKTGDSPSRKPQGC